MVLLEPCGRSVHSSYIRKSAERTTLHDDATGHGDQGRSQSFSLLNERCDVGCATADPPSPTSIGCDDHDIDKPRPTAKSSRLQADWTPPQDLFRHECPAMLQRGSNICRCPNRHFFDKPVAQPCSASWPRRDGSRVWVERGVCSVTPCRQCALLRVGMAPPFATTG